MLFSTSTISLLALAAQVHAWSTYVVPHLTATGDDSPALNTALSAANSTLVTNATILFKHGVKYNILTPIKFPVLTNVDVRIEGNLTYPEDVAAIQAIVASSVSLLSSFFASLSPTFSSHALCLPLLLPLLRFAPYAHFLITGYLDILWPLVFLRWWH